MFKDMSISNMIMDDFKNHIQTSGVSHLQLLPLDCFTFDSNFKWPLNHLKIILKVIFIDIFDLYKLSCIKNLTYHLNNLQTFFIDIF